MDPTKSYRRLPERGNNNCFGCSATNPSGLQLKFYTDEASVLSWLKVPPHLCGWDRLVHGGVIATILDEIMGWSVLHLLHRVALTKSITVDYLKPVRIEEELKAEGRIVEVTSEREAIVEGLLYCRKEVLCARSRGTFALFTPEAMHRMQLLDDATLRFLEPLAE